MQRIVEDETAKYVWIWGILPPDLTKCRAEQTRDVLVEMERQLAAYDMTFANVVRTWFYNQDINDWYADFNAARTEFFVSRKVFETFLPASTGIGHTNPFGAALVAGVVAMKPKNDSATKITVVSPLQAEAMTYRSSFSRAAETISASGRRLWVSGTASILPGSSEVAYKGDVAQQINCAMTAALAIVTSRGMTINDINRVVVYLKDKDYMSNWQLWLCQHHLPADFAEVLIADVCRPDWLFEVELDAFSVANYQ